ncbi:MAG: glycine cleavage system aminomethyltransferase GcvT [bacterium]
MELKRLVLHDEHRALGGKMVPFAGFEMPIHYSSIIDEHLAVRENVGCFDVSHMGEFRISGADAELWLNRMTINNVSALAIGQAQYSAMLYPDGGMVDDLIVYRFSDHWMLVVNAANIAKDFQWLQEHLEGEVKLRDISDEVTLLAIQGRNAVNVVSELFGEEIRELKYYHFQEFPCSVLYISPTEGGDVFNGKIVVSRTGYTGDDGFEIYIFREYARSLWARLWDAGRRWGMKPAGLGARDSLRLEAGYCLYGNDIDATTNPIEAGLGWITKITKPVDFIGKEAVIKAKADIQRHLVGFVVNGKTLPRPHYDIKVNNQLVGHVTSGGFSPLLQKPIGLGYIKVPYHKEGTPVEISFKERATPGVIVPKAFYKRDY